MLSVMALHREVNNGGFDQFFHNSSLKYGQSIVYDLKRIWGEADRTNRTTCRGSAQTGTAHSV